MLRLKFLFGLLPLFLVAVISCKKDSNNNSTSYQCTTCTKSPEATSANDASTKGIYKGIVVGSSGTIKFDIANNGSTITATMIVDGTTVNLTSNVTWANGQAYVAPFTGTMNGQSVTINFSVGLSGSNPTITSTNIPGHPNAVITVVKETSASLVECFEGTYKTSEPATGTFNILLSRSLGIWGGVAREDGTADSDGVSGTIDASGKMKDDNGVTVGTLSGDQISGSFTDGNNTKVTISGKRTL